MELAVLFIVVCLFIGLITVLKGNKRIPCHDWGKIHKWVVRGEEGNTYLVCETCRYLPGGDQEEGNGGNGDYDV